MSKKLIYLVCFVLVLGVTLPSAADADEPYLVGCWKLDGDALDSSGNDRHGTLVGDAHFVTGWIDQAVELDGSGDYVNIDGYKGILSTNAVTVTAWIQTTGNGTMVYWGRNSGGRRVDFRVSSGRLRVEHGNGNLQGDTTVNDGEWHHVAVIIPAGATISYPEVKLYLNGQDDSRHTTDPDVFRLAEHNDNVDLTFGRRTPQDDRHFPGLIDDVRIYERVLMPSQVQDMFNGIPPFKKAYAPSPADGAEYGEAWGTLQWSAGSDGVSRDVYFGDNFNDVAAGTGDTFQGNQTGTFLVVGYTGFAYPDGFVPGTTYYWRVDEVEADGTIQKGNVWSFEVPALIATEPSPADGTKFADPNLTLSWKEGFNAMLHTVYFGDNFDDVNDAVGGFQQADTTYTPPGPLEFEKTYYWRIDEFDGTATHKGDLWSFRVQPFIPITDPNLVCWWTLEEGSGTIVLDWSGHGHNGEFRGNPQWVAGYDGGALHFSTDSNYVVHSLGGASDWAAGTMALWVKADNVGQDQYSSVFSSHVPNTAGFQIDVDGGDPGIYRINPSGLIFGTATTNWVHLAVAFNGTSANLYYNGYWAGSGTLNDTTFNQFAIAQNRNAENSLFGIIDDFRMYDKVLTQEEIKQVMRGDPLLAWDPSPTNGSTPDIEQIRPLSWSPGDNASRHDVYFGTDRDAVADANASDTTGIYRVRQNPTSYSPPEALEFGQRYYWRVDEYNNDATVSEGRIWSFTVADFIEIDDFEDYNDFEPDRIFDTWMDGWDVPTNGSEVGYANPDFPAGEHHVETTIVHDGDQSMPYFFDTNFKYSEASMALNSPRDWTKHGVKALSLWFRGYPESVGSFVEGPAGTYTMTASGADIWGTSDEFHFAWKQLNGPGSITAKVESVQNTNNWAKAGVMIRDTLEPDSTHGMMVVTPAQGVAFQRRTVAGDTSSGTTEAGITSPQWVKIERDIGGNVTASYSADGITWTQIGGDVIYMTTPIYIGLALTSHNTNATCEAGFSNVLTTGTVTGQWQSQDIGILSNVAAPMYVAVSNSNGPTATVYHDDPNATLTDTWTEWNIELKDFADQGVNLTNVDKIAIGFGDKNNLRPGGSGMMYFDDIRLYRPRCIPSLLKPVASFNDDCVVDYLDLEILADDWLTSGYDVTVVAPSDANLVAHYEFENNLLDSSSNLYHGDPCGIIVYAAGSIGQALDLDSTNYVNVTGCKGVTGTQSRTCSAWIKTATTGEIMSWGRDSAGQKWIFRVQTSNGTDGAIRVEVNGGYIVGDTDVRDGQWHHVAAVLMDDGSPNVTEMELYVDGILEVISARLDEPINTASDDSDVRIGKALWGNRPFTGQIDDVYIYGRALSQGELANLAGMSVGATLTQPLQPLLSTTADTDLHDDEKIDFKDFAVLIDMWLDEQLWPEW